MTMRRSLLTELAAALGGLPVFGSLPGSAAERAGIRYGDVLMSVDGQPTPNWDAYLTARDSSGPTITVQLFRDGAEFTVELELDRSHRLDTQTVASLLGLQNEGE
jgi:S1-C subfamily serine protease